MPDLIERIQLAREGSAVERCHVFPHLQRYSVGHHSLDLVTLIAICWAEDHDGDLPSAGLMWRAAVHDLPERITGDQPSPVKETLGNQLIPMEKRAEAFLSNGETPGLADEEEVYLEEGDRLELWLWCHEEATRGNGARFQPWIVHYWDYWQEHLLLPPSYRKIIHHVKYHGLGFLPYALELSLIRG